MSPPPPAAVALRPVPRDDWERLFRVIDHAFGETTSEPVKTLERSVHEDERSIGAYDGAELVGCASAYSLQMTVPGGVRPVAGVTYVAVLPSHRRRGILAAMMRRQLDDIHASGHEAVAALWATEGAIYGRYGYGGASRSLRLTVPRSAAALEDQPFDPSLRLRLLDPTATVAELDSAVREVDRLRRPGMFVRDARWQARACFDDPGERSGRGELRCVVASDDDGPRGYARYATESRWAPQGSAAITHVRELHASDPAAGAALWRYLTDLDLTAEVSAVLRPSDDPVLHLVRDRRRVLVARTDGLFVRLVDLGRALTERTYARDVDVVLDVRDDFCPWNTGVWRLRAAGDDVTCERSTDAPEVALAVRELGGAYLGGTSLQSLAAAGLVQELRPGALAPLSAAFRHEPAPWCPEIF
jgi:predicted acetyltransferase